MPSSDSVTVWITRLKTGDQEAAQRLWERYFDRLVDLAGRRLKTASRRVADEEDVALSVFETLCRSASKGRLERVVDRDDLWWLLLAATKRRAINLRIHEARLKRGGGHVETERDLVGGDASDHEFSLDDLPNEEPTPEFLAILDEQQQHLMDVLRDDRLRGIALWRMEGYQNSEIAEKLGVSIRTVERKLNLIRTKWTQQFDR